MLTACTWVYYRITGSNDDLNAGSFVQDIICSLPILALLSTRQAKGDPASRLLRRLGAVAGLFSAFSFTLYVSHVPTIFLLRHFGRVLFGRDQLAPGAPLDCLIFFGMAAITVALSYLSYRLFESHTVRIRRLVKEVLLRPRPASATAVVMPAE